MPFGDREFGRGRGCSSESAHQQGSRAKGLGPSRAKEIHLALNSANLVLRKIIPFAGSTPFLRDAMQRPTATQRWRAAENSFRKVTASRKFRKSPLSPSGRVHRRERWGPGAAATKAAPEDDSLHSPGQFAMGVLTWRTGHWCLHTDRSRRCLKSISRFDRALSGPSIAFHSNPIAGTARGRVEPELGQDYPKARLALCGFGTAGKNLAKRLADGGVDGLHTLI